MSHQVITCKPVKLRSKLRQLKRCDAQVSCSLVRTQRYDRIYCSYCKQEKGSPKAYIPFQLCMIAGQASLKSQKINNCMLTYQTRKKFMRERFIDVALKAQQVIKTISRKPSIKHQFVSMHRLFSKLLFYNTGSKKGP